MFRTAKDLTTEEIREYKKFLTLGSHIREELSEIRRSTRRGGSKKLGL